jgi:5-formyltetrahydrofolate cyclo-ligase
VGLNKRFWDTPVFAFFGVQRTYAAKWSAEPEAGSWTGWQTPIAVAAAFDSIGLPPLFFSFSGLWLVFAPELNIGDFMSNKGELRRHYRALVAAQTATVAAEACERVNRVLCNWLAPNADFAVPAHLRPCFGGYQALPGEPDLSEAYERLEARGFRFAFPRIDGESLRFYHAHGAQWTAAHRWGLREPDPSASEEVQLHEFDGVLVLGLAFDRRGVRLGRGKGFYDRALSQYNGIKVGVAFSAQLAVELPMDAHDVRMDWIVTENDVLEGTEK